ncbi:hypothetical protein GCM10022254_28960 [Actinomadura meridiana]|uniref:Uncharacterized protein n=1 Tax=Actinomadura meridiana TaxID=559626 RepID=A0ABP8C0G6_9ACTN
MALVERHAQWSAADRRDHGRVDGRRLGIAGPRIPGLWLTALGITGLWVVALWIVALWIVALWIAHAPSLLRKPVWRKRPIGTSGPDHAPVVRGAGPPARPEARGALRPGTVPTAGSPTPRGRAGDRVVPDE